MKRYRYTSGIIHVIKAQKKDLYLWSCGKLDYSVEEILPFPFGDPALST